MFTLYQIGYKRAFRVELFDLVWTEQWPGTRTSRSHTSSIKLGRLAERDWCTKSQSSLLNVHHHLSGFQASLLPINISCGPNTCSHCIKVWHRTYPICDAPLSRATRRSSLRYINRAKITVLTCEQEHYPVWFSCRSKSHTVWWCEHSLKGAISRLSSSFCWYLYP